MTYLLSFAVTTDMDACQLHGILNEAARQLVEDLEPDFEGVEATLDEESVMVIDADYVELTSVDPDSNKPAYARGCPDGLDEYR